MALSPVAKTGILVIVGLLVAVSGLLTYMLFPYLLRWQVEQKLVLSPSSEVYEHWRKVPVPIYNEFFFFNVTNPLDVKSGSSKPILEELGPYTFRETREKINITWHDNGTVSYRQIRRWFFEPDMTRGSLDDLITNINVPLAGSAAFAFNYNEEFLRNAIVQIAIQTNSSLFVTKSVGDLLFNGYDDELIKFGNSLGISGNFDKFGWYYMKNNSDDGLYTVYTGAEGMANYGFVNKWNGVSELEKWNGTCNNINGTPGEMWPPFTAKKTDKLSIFVSDICRSLTLKYLEDTTVYGVEAYRYILDETTFDNGKFNSDNKCFCTGECLPSGALDISSCQHGAPALVSFPHFLFADSFYTRKIIGLKPTPDKHKFYMDLEPDLGVPLNVQARMQINVVLHKIPEISELAKLQSTTYFPMFWCSSSASVDTATAKKLKFVKNDVPRYVTIGAFLLVVVGGGILTVGLLYAIWKNRNLKKEKGTYTAVKLKKVQM